MGRATFHYAMNKTVRFAEAAMRGLDEEWARPGGGEVSDDLKRAEVQAYRSAQWAILAWVWTQGYAHRDDEDESLDNQENDHDHQ